MGFNHYMQGKQTGNLKYLGTQLDLPLSLRFQIDYLLAIVHFIRTQRFFCLVIHHYVHRKEDKIWMCSEVDLFDFLDLLTFDWLLTLDTHFTSKNLEFKECYER